MRGILDALGYGQTPFANYFDERRNAITGFGAGLIGGTPQEKMRNALLMAQQGQQQDTAYQTELKKQQQSQEQLNRTLQFLQEKHPDLAQAVQGGAPIGDVWGEAMRRERPGGGVEPPSSVREWQHFNTLTPEQQGQYLTMKRANPYLDLGPQYAQPDQLNPGQVAGTIQKDNYTPAYEQAAGGAQGKRDVESAAQRPIQEANLTRLDAQTDNVISTVDKALDQADWVSTGIVGQATGGLAGTPAFDLRETAKTIKANLGFAELQAMRDASPTGGALGQVAIQELEALQSTLASLNPDQSEAQLRENLKLVRDLLERQKMYRRMAAEAKYGVSGQGGAQQAPAAGMGGGDGWTVLGVE